jgi:WD40 repeat protein
MDRAAQEFKSGATVGLGITMAMQPGGAATAEDASGVLKVFISYSRRDVEFADDLDLFLETSGFDPIIDRHDIDHNDDWKPRLGELIHSCDTVVFVLTETSAASPICAWEVEEAARLGKRRLVVTPGPLPKGVQPPPGLGAANWIHCWRNPDVPDSSRANGKRDLEKALKQDVRWLRERTRLMEQALAWTTRGAAADSVQLLRGDLLAEAQAWAQRAPKDETIPAEVSQFLGVSTQHEVRLKAEAEAGFKEREEALAKAALASARVRRASLIGAGVAALFLVAAAVAGWFALRGFDQVAQQKAQIAEVNSNVIARESAALFDEIGSGDMTESLLMALYADPEAKAPGIDPKYAPKDGYASARARLAAAHEANSLTKRLKEHKRSIFSTAVFPTSAAFSPDGKFIVTGSEDRTARIWDASTGQPLRTLEGHESDITSAAFSPDGRFIVTGSGDNTARIWDATTGEPLRTLQGHEEAVLYAAFSPDGKFIVTGSVDSTAWIWDATTGQTLHTLQGHERLVTSAAFSPDGKWIVTGSHDNTARIWDASTGQPLRTLQGHESGVTSAAFSPDGKFIVTGSYDRTALIWHAATGQPLRTLQGHEKMVASTAFSPDGRFIVTGSGDNTARIWDATTGQPLRTLQGHEQPVASTAFSPDGKFIVTGSWDRTARIWDATTGQPLRTLQGHESWVNSAAFSPDGKFIVTGSVDNTARIWDAETGQPLRTLQGHEGGVASAAFSPDGKFIVTGSRDSTARIWAVPEILLADAPTQVTMACKMLADARAPLAFSIADIARYPVLQGVAEDPANPGFLVSPCRGVLPDEAFARDP